MRVKAAIDRFEGAKAVLLMDDGGQAVVWPRTFLPREAREGDVVWLSISLDAATTRAARDEAAALLRQLTEGDK